MAHVLYRFYSRTGQLLYVGITMDPAQRFKDHRKTKDWWQEVAGISIEHYSSRKDLANAERRAIRVERPQHNITHATRQPPVIAEPPTPPTTAIDDDLAELFAAEPSPPTVAFNWYSTLSLFSGSRDTCFGYVTEKEYQRRVEEERQKLAARAACTFCDPLGYRGTVVCDHVDRWTNRSKRIGAS